MASLAVQRYNHACAVGKFEGKIGIFVSGGERQNVYKFTEWYLLNGRSMETWYTME